jgi:hypothetical protein
MDKEITSPGLSDGCDLEEREGKGKRSSQCLKKIDGRSAMAKNVGKESTTPELEK